MRGFVTTSLGDVHYRERGSGFPLVLLHRTADSSTQWDDVVPCLAARFRTIAPDTPGFGDSAAPPEPPEIAEYARTVVELLDARGIDRCHLLGHRTGATIAVEVAAAWPERVGRVILSGLVDYPPDDRRPTVTVEAGPDLLPDGSHYTARWAAVRAAWPWASPIQIHRSVADSLRASPTWRWAGEAVRRYPLADRAPLVVAPVLLLFGESDRFASWLPSHLARFPQARAHVFPGGHDLPMLQLPSAFCQVVIPFLEEGGPP
ncbi:MAG: alpha/beta hydrolase [Dehalococcoidia bacterium]|nr:MAG: alpha/beta hydrolase [Dehalococcoidia bacterium]